MGEGAGGRDASAAAAAAASPAPGIRAALAWSLFVPLFLLNYWPSLKWMWARWMEDGSYTSHGPLIPLVSAFLLWNRRSALLPARGPGAASGLLVFGGALLLHLIAGLADVSSVSGFTMVPLLLGFLAVLHGWGLVRAAWFPIFFLVFMVPPPEFVISTLNFSLKLVAADTAEWLLNLFGVPAVRQGSFMLFGADKLAIGDVCSGLRSLLSLVALSVLYAWMVRSRSRAHVLATLAFALPAAIIGNGVRIMAVCMLVVWLGQDRVFKPLVGDWDLHLFTGSIIFIAALGCLVGLTLILDRFLPAAPGRRDP
jgi:exosortase